MSFSVGWPGAQRSNWKGLHGYLWALNSAAANASPFACDSVGKSQELRWGQQPLHGQKLLVAGDSARNINWAKPRARVAVCQIRTSFAGLSAGSDSALHQFHLYQSSTDRWGHNAAHQSNSPHGNQQTGTCLMSCFKGAAKLLAVTEENLLQACSSRHYSIYIFHASITHFTLQLCPITETLHTLNAQVLTRITWAHLQPLLRWLLKTLSESNTEPMPEFPSWNSKHSFLSPTDKSTEFWVIWCLCQKCLNFTSATIPGPSNR